MSIKIPYSIKRASNSRMQSGNLVYALHRERTGGSSIAIRNHPSGPSSNRVNSALVHERIFPLGTHDSIISERDGLKLSPD